MHNMDEEKLHNIIHQMIDVPFSDDLQQRILEEAKRVNQKPILRKRLFNRAAKLGTAIAGILAAAVLIFAVVNQPMTMKSILGVHTAATNQAKQVNVYGMVKAQLQVTNLHIGQKAGYKNNSEVIATLTNLSSSTIHADDVFGILAFSKTATLNNLGDADWIAFVNGPEKNYSLAPRQSMQWVFHPVGAPHGPSSALTEIPHLMFYSSQLTSSANADEKWEISPLKISRTSVELNTLVHTQMTNGQSIIVQADLTNPTDKIIDLSHLLSFIWFDRNTLGRFTKFGEMRFITHVSAGTGGITVLNPGETVHVSFHLIGSASAKYFSNTAHVAIVSAP